MPQASILELERPPLDLPRPAPARRPGPERVERPGSAAAPVAGSGRLYLIERCGADLALTAAEREALVGANIIVYERSLAGLVAAVLPLGGYAEPAPEARRSAEPVFERCLKFALDGWRVVQLMERRPPAERSRWIEDAVDQLAAAGVSSDTPVRMLVDAVGGGPVDIATRLRSAHAAIDDRDLPGGLIMVLGPIAAGPGPQVYAFGANGLAG